jgi:hypothetical protein
MMSRHIECRNSPAKWLDGWTKMGIDMTSYEDMKFTHFDVSVIEMMHKHGPDLFALQDIWRVDWSNLVNQAKKAGKLPDDFVFIQPRRRFVSRLFHIYMILTIDIRFIRYLERKLFGKNFSYES